MWIKWEELTLVTVIAVAWPIDQKMRFLKNIFIISLLSFYLAVVQRARHPEMRRSVVFLHHVYKLVNPLEKRLAGGGSFPFRVASRHGG